MSISNPTVTGERRKKDDSKWVLDKHIPVTILIVFISQAAVSLWWVATFTTKTDLRIEALEKQTVALNLLPQRMAAVEAQLIASNQLLRDIRDDQRSKNN